MSELCILICRRDDPASPTLTELASFALPSPDLRTLQPATTLDDLEATTLTTGMSVLHRLLQLTWEQLDAALVAQYRAQHPDERLPADGSVPLTVVSRFGTLPLRRQVLADRAHHAHVVPGNAVLPEHGGVVTTCGLQEWACLLPQELPFSSVARLLGWQTQEPDVLSDSTSRTLVKRHGQVLRQASRRRARRCWSGPWRHACSRCWCRASARGGGQGGRRRCTQRWRRRWGGSRSAAGGGGVGGLGAGAGGAAGGASGPRGGAAPPGTTPGRG
jgi:hypothetical protein